MFFKKKPKGPQPDFVIFLNKIAKYKQMIALLEKIDQKKPVILVAFFQDTFSQVDQLMAAKAMNYTKPQISLANGFNLINDTQLTNLETNQVHQVCCLDVHPLFSVNNRMYQHFKDASFDQIDCFTSLDEAIMTLFDSGRMQSVISHLGLTETDHISHSMVNKSILKAMKKLEENIKDVDNNRESQDQWISSNAKK